MSEVLQTVLILTSICVFFGTILAIANIKLKVFEDPRIDKVEEMLPSANCGACGFPGCRAFAEKVVANEVNPSKCSVSSPEGIEDIASYLGVEAGQEEKRVARLLCAGGVDEAHNKSQYKGGMTTCRAESIVAGGSKDCTWGCLGLGDCSVACTFDAIVMNENGLPQVDPEKCTACGDCVEACPKDLFTIMPISQKLIVQCKSLLEGDSALERCSVACTGCGKCALDATPGGIDIRQGLAVINYEKFNEMGPEVTLRCPTNAITWLMSDGQFSKSQRSWDPLGRVEKEEHLSNEYFQ